MSPVRKKVKRKTVRKARARLTRVQREKRSERKPRAEEPMRHPLHPISGPEAQRQLDRARKICLALPDTTEKIAWGASTFRVGKIFAMFDDHHHGEDRIALWCPAPKGMQEILVASEPERFFRPPYVGAGGWVGIVLTNIGDARLTEMVREAYRMMAPK